MFWQVKLKSFWGDLGHQVGWGHPAGRGSPGDMTFEKGNGNHAVMLTGQAKLCLQTLGLY